jgi:hypothetical protein
MTKETKGTIHIPAIKAEAKASQEQKDLELTAPLEKLAGSYSNVALVRHTKNEFVIDFILNISGQASLVSRVITSPEHIKRLKDALAENIKKYEENFGKIKTVAQ